MEAWRLKYPNAEKTPGGRAPTTGASPSIARKADCGRPDTERQRWPFPNRCPRGPLSPLATIPPVQVFAYSSNDPDLSDFGTGFK